MNTAANILLSADSLKLSQRVHSASVRLHEGELIGLIGPNGAGKSTLLSLLAGIEKADSGSVHLQGKPMNTIAGRLRAQTIGWLEQTGAVHWPVSVERLVMLGRLPHMTSWSRPTTADYQAVERALDQTDCLHLRHRDTNSLSGGERARAMLARALAAEPRVLLADEPVSALDLGHQLQVMDVLRAFASDGRGAIVVMHELALAARYCDRLYLMHETRSVACDTPPNVLTATRLAEVYEVLVHQGEVESLPWMVAARRTR